MFDLYTCLLIVLFSIKYVSICSKFAHIKRLYLGTVFLYDLMLLFITNDFRSILVST